MRRVRGRRWLLAASLAALVGTTSRGEQASEAPRPIDLPTALRLAGAQSLDIALARERLAEASAAEESAREQFLPWLSPGAGYRRHEGRIQKVEGTMIDATKQSDDAGAALRAQVDVGDAYFKTLAARQIVAAAGADLDAQRRDTVLAAAEGYFELAKAQGELQVSGEAVRIAEDYERQLHQAVGIGIAFKGEELRARVQTERERLRSRQAEEARRVAAARLVQTLHLEPTVELLAQDTDLVPLSLTGADVPVASLVRQAMESRPELKQSQSLVAAARENRAGAMYGPIIPLVGAVASAGGLGGGVGNATGHFGDAEDYGAGLSWRIGPGGLFDFGRIHAAESRLRGAELFEDKLKDEIARQVVEADARVRSLVDQLAMVKRQVAAAQDGLRLTQQRKEFGVGNVLENIQAEDELTRARTDYVAAISEYDKAQYRLRYTIGGSPPEPLP